MGSRAGGSHGSVRVGLQVTASSPCVLKPWVWLCVGIDGSSPPSIPWGGSVPYPPARGGHQHLLAVCSAAQGSLLGG